MRRRLRRPASMKLKNRKKADTDLPTLPELDSDQEWNRAFSEMRTFRGPSQTELLNKDPDGTEKRRMLALRRLRSRTTHSPKFSSRGSGELADAQVLCHVRGTVTAAGRQP